MTVVRQVTLVQLVNVTEVSLVTAVRQMTLVQLVNVTEVSLVTAVSLVHHEVTHWVRSGHPLHSRPMVVLSPHCSCTPHCLSLTCVDQWRGCISEM